MHKCLIFMTNFSHWRQNLVFKINTFWVYNVVCNCVCVCGSFTWVSLWAPLVKTGIRKRERPSSSPFSLSTSFWRVSERRSLTLRTSSSSTYTDFSALALPCSSSFCPDKPSDHTAGFCGFHGWLDAVKLNLHTLTLSSSG